jgi:transposase InsO family protein
MCDASDWRTGAALSYGPSLEEARPVAYDSMQLSSAERNYPTHEKELLAVVRALQKWRTDLLGVPFIVYTDHKPLEEFKTQKNLSRRQARWQEFLGQYDFDVHYIPGEENTVADALSRLPPDELQPFTIGAVGSLRIATDPAWLDSIKRGYQKDPWCKSLREQRSLIGFREQDGLLYVGDRFVIPRVKDVREHLYRLAHDALGHFGGEKSYAALRSSYYWPQMRRDIENYYVPSCDHCQRNKSLTRKPAGPLHPLPVPDGRGRCIAIDFVGPLPNEDGRNCICTITDRSGADIRIFATRTDITAEDFAVQFFDNWFCENGLPEEIVSDRDKLFVSKFWRALHKLTGVKLQMSTSYHPQTDGASERTNKTIIQLLRYHVGRNQKGWARALPRVRFDIMNTVNASTGFSPFQLHIGRSPRLIPPIFSADRHLAEEEFGLSATDATRIIQQMDTDFLEAQDNLRLAKTHQAIHANRRRGNEIVYKEGDKVLLSTLHRRREYLQRGDHRVAKFMCRYDGPYTVTKAHPETSSYTLALPSHMKIFPTFHSSLLRPYIANDPSLFPDREPTRPGPIIGPTGEEEWPVEKILDRKRCGRGWRYKVKWAGYDEGPDDWLPGSEVVNLEAYGEWLAENEPDKLAQWRIDMELDDSAET